MKVYLLVGCALLSGCTSLADNAPFVRKSAFISFMVVDEITPPQAVGTVGLTECSSQGICKIQVLEDYLVECAGHEVIHTVKGNWHPGRKMHCKSGSY